MVAQWCVESYLIDARVKCDKSWVWNKDWLSFRVKPVWAYKEYSWVGWILNPFYSKFCNHAHMLVDGYKHNLEIWGMDCGYTEGHILTEVLLRVASLEDLRSKWKRSCKIGSMRYIWEQCMLRQLKDYYTSKLVVKCLLEKENPVFTKVRIIWFYKVWTTISRWE